MSDVASDQVDVQSVWSDTFETATDLYRRLEAAAEALHGTEREAVLGAMTIVCTLRDLASQYGGVALEGDQSTEDNVRGEPAKAHTRDQSSGRSAETVTVSTEAIYPRI